MSMWFSENSRKPLSFLQVCSLWLSHLQYVIKNIRMSYMCMSDKLTEMLLQGFYVSRRWYYYINAIYLDCSPHQVHDLVIINVIFGNYFQVQLYSEFTKPNKFNFFLPNEQFTPVKIPSILVLCTNKTLSKYHLPLQSQETGSLHG